MTDTTKIDEQPICLCGAVKSPAAEDSFDLDEVVRCEGCISRHGIARVGSIERVSSIGQVRRGGGAVLKPIHIEPEPVVCRTFGCGRRLTYTEQLYGGRCLACSGDKKETICTYMEYQYKTISGARRKLASINAQIAAYEKNRGVGPGPFFMDTVKVDKYIEELREQITRIQNRIDELSGSSKFIKQLTESEIF